MKNANIVKWTVRQAEGEGGELLLRVKQEHGHPVYLTPEQLLSKLDQAAKDYINGGDKLNVEMEPRLQTVLHQPYISYINEHYDYGAKTDGWIRALDYRDGHDIYISSIHDNAIVYIHNNKTVHNPTNLHGCLYTEVNTHGSNGLSFALCMFKLHGIVTGTGMPSSLDSTVEIREEPRVLTVKLLGRPDGCLDRREQQIEFSLHPSLDRVSLAYTFSNRTLKPDDQRWLEMNDKLKPLKLKPATQHQIRKYLNNLMRWY